MSNPRLITILGPTASGKTALAAEVAWRMDGEIISADSRQVFRGMDIGTGKDLADYNVHGCCIPHHLIDICSPEEEYNAYRFMCDFSEAFSAIVNRGKQPIMCGGTGLYLDAIIRGYRLANAPRDEAFRQEASQYSDEELTARLASYIKLHNHTDTETRERLLRALEIQEYAHRHPEGYIHLPEMRHSVYGIRFERQEIIQRIEHRLRNRIEEGMISEVEQLINNGVSTERLMKFGLEYRHTTRFITGQCSHDEMFTDLFTDIRRFAKRQMTWFRRMERCGVEIKWIDGNLTLNEKAAIICDEK